MHGRRDGGQPCQRATIPPESTGADGPWYPCRGCESTRWIGETAFRDGVLARDHRDRYFRTDL